MSRFHLASLLAMIGALALGLAAMRDGSDLLNSAGLATPAPDQ